MPNQNTQKTDPGPFIQLLNGAEDIQVESVITPTENSASGYFTYYVKVLPKEIIAKPVVQEHLSDTYLLENARILIENEDYKLARNIYSLVLRRNLKHCDALVGLGICLGKLEQPEASAKCLKAAVKLHRDPKAAYLLGCYFQDIEHEEQALEYFEQTQEGRYLCEEDRFDLFKRWGNTKARLSQPNSANEFYHKALTLQPNSVPVHINLGTVALKEQAYEESERYFNRALELEPQSSRAICGLGMLAIAQEQFALANKHLVEALKFDPTNRIAALQLSQIVRRTENYKDACHLLEMCLKHHPDDIELLISTASIQLIIGRAAAAKSNLDSILKLEKDHEGALILMEEVETQL